MCRPTIGYRVTKKLERCQRPRRTQIREKVVACHVVDVGVVEDVRHWQAAAAAAVVSVVSDAAAAAAVEHAANVAARHHHYWLARRSRCSC